MATLVLRSIECSKTSGGEIKLQVGTNDLITTNSFVTITPPSELESYPLPPATIPPFADLEIADAVIDFNLYDEKFLDGEDIVKAMQISTGLTALPYPSVTFDYNRRVGGVRVPGTYKVTYEVTDIPIIGPTRTYLIRTGNLAIQFILFTLFFLRDLVLSVAVPLIKLFSRQTDQYTKK